MATDAHAQGCAEMQGRSKIYVLCITNTVTAMLLLLLAVPTVLLLLSFH